MKIHEFDGTNDIRYRGPLTYQHFRIAGWLFIALAQFYALLELGDAVFPEKMPSWPLLRPMLGAVSQIAAPLLLIANFAVILSGRESYKKLLIRFGALTAAAVVAFALIYERYAVGVLAAQSSRAAAYATLDEMFAERGFLAFNLFLDLFLCTLVLFFMDYVPKKWFTGKKLILFRLFALIPVLYEAVSVTLKVLSSTGEITIPVRLFPFLTTKPPFGFVIFVALALFIKRRERKFIKNGKTLDDYHAFLKTNANSWHFSVHSAIIIVVAVILDLIVACIAAALIISSRYSGDVPDAAMTQAVMQVLKSGFGETTPLIFVAPFMLLFSYNREPKNPKLDRIIPIGGVALIAVIYIEGIFYALKRFM